MIKHQIRHGMRVETAHGWQSIRKERYIYKKKERRRDELDEAQVEHRAPGHAGDDARTQIVIVSERITDHLREGFVVKNLADFRQRGSVCVAEK